MGKVTFTGPGIICLLNSAGPTKVKHVESGNVVGYFEGEPYTGSCDITDTTGRVCINEGEHCITWPCKWDTSNGCGCPEAPQFLFKPESNTTTDPTSLEKLCEILAAIEAGNGVIPPPTCSVTSFCGPNDTIICKKVCVSGEGVETTTETDTFVDCEVAIQDPEVNYICNAETGFFDEVTKIFSEEDGSVLFSETVPTTIVCLKTPPPECFIACAKNDKRPVWVKKAEDGTITVFESNGTTPTTDEWEFCTDKEYLITSHCRQLVSDASVRFDYTLCINKEDPTDTFTIWVDDAGAVVAQPTGATERCEEVDCDFQTLPYKKKEFYAGVENTGLSFNFFYNVEFTLANGEKRVVNLPAASGWGPQMTAWDTALTDAFPEACEVANHWYEWRPDFLPNQGAGAIPPADFDFTEAFGQYIQLTFCPEDVGFTPISAVVVETDNAKREGYNLILGTGESKVEYLNLCISCNDECESDEIPKCAIPVAAEFPEVPAPLCTYETLGPFCDAVQADPGEITEDDVVQSGVFVTVTSGIDGVKGTNPFILDGTDPVDYTTLGELVDCDSLAASEFPLAKPEGEQIGVRELCAKFAAAVIDNNAGVPSATSPIYHFSDTIEFKTELVNGTSFNWTQIATSGWTPQFESAGGWTDSSRPDSFISAYAAATGGEIEDLGNFSFQIGDSCKVQIGCGQTGCGGFPGMHPDVAKAGLNAFFRHLSIICCDEGLLPKTTEVISTTSDVGSRADVGHIQNDQPTAVITKFREVTVCKEGVISTYLIDNCGKLIDPKTLPPCDCWEDCSEELTGECDFCVGNTIFQTPTTVEYDITGVKLDGEDISDKFSFSFPISGNTFTTLIPFRDELIECLEGRGYSTTYIQGRDGWTIKWDGQPLVIEQTNGNQDSAQNANCLSQKFQRVGLSDCDKAFFKSLLKDCANCQPTIVTDAVCNDQNQTVDDIEILAGNPIIRKTITYYRQVGCECVEDSVVTRYYNFNDPAQEFKGEVVVTGLCDFESNSVTRCDRNGQEIQVTSITVNTPDGGISQVTYADSNGDPIPEPLLPLSICNPQVQLIKGCVIQKGVEVFGTLHLQYDNIGCPGYDVSKFVPQGQVKGEQLGSATFICKDGPTEACPKVQSKYCYNISTFPFPCPESSIVVNGEEVDLCGGESNPTPGSYIQSGDCDAGGVRSINSTARHPNAPGVSCASYPFPTNDPLDTNAALANGGGLGADFGYGPTVGNTGNFLLNVADVFGLSGASGPTMEVKATWSPGSGTAIGVYNCATGEIVPLSNAFTPATYDLNSCGVRVFNGPTGSWGQTGTFSPTFDTGGADYKDLWIYTVVMNQDDGISDFEVDGNPVGTPACNIVDQATLINALSETTGTPWVVEGESICTTTTAVLGALSCGETSVDPVITDATVQRDIPLVKVVAANEESPVGYECVDGVPHLMIAIKDANGRIIGDRSIASSVEGLCNCCDEKCQKDAAACILMDAFDYDRGLVTANDTSQFEILLDGQNQATVVHDYTTTSDNTNVSSYYTPIIAAINAVPGWTISLETDVLQSEQGKPTWKVEYAGTSASVLEINQNNGGSILTLTADGAGGIVGTTNWGVDSFPFRECVSE